MAWAGTCSPTGRPVFDGRLCRRQPARKNYMKITRLEAIPVWYEPTDEYHALFGTGKKKGTMVHAREGWFANIRYKENVFVKISTDEGIVGWGEACAHPVTSETQAGILSAVELFGRT